MTIRSARAPFLFVAASLALFAAACGDDPPKDPEAELRFFHASETLGTIDVSVNEDTVQVAPSSLSPAIVTDPGDLTLVVANTGAQEPLFEHDATLAEGPHVFVIAGNPSDGSLGTFEVGLNPPELTEGQVAYQVVSVLTSDTDFDFYPSVDDPGQTIARYGQSDFIVGAPADAAVRIYNAGLDPASNSPVVNLSSTQLAFREGGVYAILIKGSATTGFESEITRLN